MPPKPSSPRLTISTHGKNNNIYKITLHKNPENRLNRDYAQEIIRAFRWIEEQLGRDSEGAVITSSEAGGGKFWCTVCISAHVL
jgi:Delta3-Delta2-enoyl-CoA isomerase